MSRRNESKKAVAARAKRAEQQKVEGFQINVKVAGQPDQQWVVNTASTKKERAIAYIRVSLTAKVTKLADSEARLALNTELGLGDPKSANDTAAMKICVARITEVLEVLESAP